MVKYADIAKNNTKPFSDDFEKAVKAQVKIQGAATTTLKWDNNTVTAKVEAKGPLALPVVDLGVNLKQTAEFSEKGYKLTSEFSKDSSTLQAVFAEASQEYTWTQTLGAIVAAAKYTVKGEKQSWNIDAAHHAVCSPDLNVQVGASVNNDFKPELSIAFLRNSMSTALKVQPQAMSVESASLFSLACCNQPFGYDLSCGVKASHSGSAPFANPEALLVAKSSAHTIKTKLYGDFDKPSVFVSFVTKAPMGLTATWGYADKTSKFGANVSL